MLKKKRIDPLEYDLMLEEIMDGVALGQLTGYFSTQNKIGKEDVLSGQFDNQLFLMKKEAWHVV